jgi:hypothetical protein
VIAAVTAPFLGPNHDLLLKQMADTTLSVTALLGPEDSGRDAPARPEAAKGHLKRPDSLIGESFRR